MVPRATVEAPAEQEATGAGAVAAGKAWSSELLVAKIRVQAAGPLQVSIPRAGFCFYITDKEEKRISLKE